MEVRYVSRETCRGDIDPVYIGFNAEAVQKRS